MIGFLVKVDTVCSANIKNLPFDFFIEIVVFDRLDQTVGTFLILSDQLRCSNDFLTGTSFVTYKKSLSFFTGSSVENDSNATSL